MKKNILLRGLGLRSVKTALSVFLCIPVLRLLGLDQPFFACIAAVVATQTTVRQSFTIGLERMIGTLAGAVWALIFTSFAPPPADPGDLGLLHMLLIAAGVTLVIYSANVLQKPNAGSTGSIVFIGVMINLLPGQTPLQTTGLRALETLLGVIIAMLVNWLIFPYKENIAIKAAETTEAAAPTEAEAENKSAEPVKEEFAKEDLVKKEPAPPTEDTQEEDMPAKKEAPEDPAR